VFSEGSDEITRHRSLRDRLRADGSDRLLYASTTQRLAQLDWPTTDQYAEAKAAVVEAISRRARPPATAPGRRGDSPPRPAPGGGARCRVPCYVGKACAMRTRTSFSTSALGRGASTGKRSAPFEVG